MKELHLAGWLCRDYDGLLALKEDDRSCSKRSIMKDIEYFSDDTCEYDSPYLGGMRSIIQNVSMRVYATSKKCSLDDAMCALVSHLDGTVISDIEYEGYSEWTITGYSCKEFTIGGHNLDAELDKYIGKYIHLVFECR